MHFVAAVAFVIYRKVHLLLGDIAVVAAEGDERCLGVCESIYRSLLCFSELHNNHLLHGNSRK